MKTPLLLLILMAAFLFASVSCKRRTEPIDPSIPTSLQETPDEISFSEVSYGKGRNYVDLVDEMFAEIREKRPDVNAVVDTHVALLQRISEIKTQLFEHDAKSKDYYASARSHAGDIQDSSLRKTAMADIMASEGRWNRQMEERDALAEDLQRRVDELKDAVRYLKIRLTLPQIEDFQGKKKPTLIAGKDALKEQEGLMRKIEGLR